MQLSFRTYKETVDEKYTTLLLKDLNIHQSSPNVIDTDITAESDVSIIDEAVLSCDSEDIVADVDHDNENNYFMTDKLGRKHSERLSAGPSVVKLRACKLDTSSGATHSNDLAQVKEGKTVAF